MASLRFPVKVEEKLLDHVFVRQFLQHFARQLCAQLPTLLPFFPLSLYEIGKNGLKSRKVMNFSHCWILWTSFLYLFMKTKLLNTYYIHLNVTI